MPKRFGWETANLELFPVKLREKTCRFITTKTATKSYFIAVFAVKRYPLGESNPCYWTENPVSWATRRRGPVLAILDSPGSLRIQNSTWQTAQVRLLSGTNSKSFIKFSLFSLFLAGCQVWGEFFSLASMKFPQSLTGGGFPEYSSPGSSVDRFLPFKISPVTTFSGWGTGKGAIWYSGNL